MHHALNLAQYAADQGEVPVGACLVSAEGALLADGWNQPICSHDPSAHAEIVALRKAGQSLGNYRFPGSTLYVTLEPCLMCCAALLHARVKRVIFAAPDEKTDRLCCQLGVMNHPRFNHSIEWVAGGMRKEASDLLKAFFRARRAGVLESR